MCTETYRLSRRLLLVLALLQVSCGSRETVPRHDSKRRVQLGIEVFLQEHAGRLKSKNVGLVTNPTGTDSRLRTDVELLAAHPDIHLVALYGPEHGVRGDAQAGEHVPFTMDPKHHIPVFSLYGQNRMPPPGMLRDIDKYMRSFDTVKGGKAPERSMVEDIDVMVFDIQDVGTRVYTYISTMAYCMEACAESGVEFIVLDRPNPLGGVALEGPILEYPRYSSFVGLYPVPMRHGMTVGELALMFRDRFLTKKLKLTVISMKGWERSLWFDETSLPWVMPSPNMPTLDTATVYPGQVLLEGTNLSEGRGTTRPFELFGAPWIDGWELTGKLQALRLPGVAFREAWFTPSFSKYRAEVCGGAQIHVLDREVYRPLETTLHILKTVREMYPDRFRFHEEYFDKIMGTAKVREGLEADRDVRAILAPYDRELETFAELRKPYLLY